MTRRIAQFPDHDLIGSIFSFFLTGIRAAPDTVDPSLIEFLKKQASGAKYVLTVCSGAWILASTGFLNGKKATTNKSLYRRIVVCLNLEGIITDWRTLTSMISLKAATDKSIQWVPKARWVVDGKTWTSSGVTAGVYHTSIPAYAHYLLDRSTMRS